MSGMLKQAEERRQVVRSSLLLSGVIFTAFATSALVAQSEPTAATRSRQAVEAEVDAALRRFRKLSGPAQARKLEEVKLAIQAIDEPYLKSIRALAGGDLTRSALPANATHRRGSKSALGGGGAKLWQGVGFPVRQHYVFGHAQVVASDVAAGKRSQTRAASASSRAAEMRALLMGFPPDLDLALAATLSTLDRDRAADPFSQLLSRWHDGDESFYQALDRTAGTQQSVFIYDAMLDDFIRQCVPETSADFDRIKRSNDDAQDALHRAFLAYRQYRGLREALVLSLLLPPEVELPERLARYDADSDAGYSVRQIASLLLADAEQDVGDVVEAVQDAAPPLPAELWRGYQAIPAYYGVFNARMNAMIARAGHTDNLLKQQEHHRRQVRDKVAAVALASLAG